MNHSDTQNKGINDHRLPVLEGPRAWLWYVGGMRVAVLAVLAAGAFQSSGDIEPYLKHSLAFFYLFGLAGCVWYLLSLRETFPGLPQLTWAQVLIDFGVVAATVSFTGGVSSVFTFMFVVVILEAGLMLGLAQGFVFATLAAVFMLTQVGISLEPQWGRWPSTLHRDASVDVFYQFVVQVMAYYLTASISGYWTQRLHRMQQFQRDILDNMNNGFLITSSDGTITAQNLAADRILQMKEGEAVGRHVSEVLPDTEGSECPVWTALRTQKDFTRFEFETVVGDDQVILLGLSTSCMYRRDGKLIGLIASFSDLTELAEMREEIKRQDRLAVVGELAAGLAHEIRNPIAAIRGALEELRGHMESPEMVARLAGIAVRECDHLNYTVTEFLDFAREPEISREPFDVRGLLKEYQQEFEQSYGNRDGLHFETRLCEEDCQIAADKDQLKQVFAQIAKNAVEAMEGGGTLRVSVTRDPVSVAVRFDDEGPGIPPDQVARIFEPFYTTRESGVGMGLAVCNRIVTAYDGTIHAASRKEGGAAVTVRMPAARSSQP